MTEPRSNMTITDRHGLARYRRDNIVTALTDTANGISYAIRILKDLAGHDTENCVAGGASLALQDAADHLDDVLTALEDGCLAEPGDAG
jgi:hypothetical protein